MSLPASIPPRSLSLPTASPEDMRRPSLAYAVRQEPHVVCADAPLTPPLSPKPGQHIDSIAMEEKCMPISLENHQIQEPGAISQVSSDLMDVDASSPIEEDINAAARPQRLLEDEKDHLARSGIKLADFEVRGTLGMPLGSPLQSFVTQFFLKVQELSERFFWFATDSLRSRARKATLR